MLEAPRSQFPLHTTAQRVTPEGPSARKLSSVPLSLCLSIVPHSLDVHFYSHNFSWPGRF